LTCTKQLAASIAILLVLGLTSTPHAQEHHAPDAGTEPPAAPMEAAPDAGSPAEAADPAPSDAPPDALPEATAAAWAKKLGVELEALGKADRVEELAARMRAAAAAARGNRDATRAELVRAQAVLDSMPAGSTSDSAGKLTAVRRRLALGRARALRARADRFHAELEDAEAAATWLEGHRARQDEEARRRAKEAAEAARLRQEARKAEAEASEASQQKLEEIAIAEQEVLEAQDARSRKRVELATRRAAIARETYYIVERRKWRVRELETEAAAKSELTQWQVKIRAERKAILASVDGETGAEENPQEAANKLFLDLGRHRSDARAQINTLTDPLAVAAESLARAREGDAGADAEEGAEEDDKELRRGRENLAAALRERQREHVKLLELRQTLAERALDRAHIEFTFARRAQSSLVPYLPASRRNDLRALNTPNVEGVGEEFSDFWIEVQHEFRAEMRLVRELPGRIFSVEGILWLGKFGFYFLLVIIAVRVVRSRRDGFATEATRFVLDHNVFRMPPRIVVKCFELLQAVSIDVTALLGILVILHALPGDLPLFTLVQSVVFAVYAYRIGTTAVETLTLPRWYRENHDREKWGASTPVDLGNDGVDLFDLELERAQFATGTVRVLLIYTVICQFSLWVARATLGTFFLTFWIHVVGYLGYAIVVYVLLSLWKGTIARQFTRLDGGKSTAAEDFVSRHKDRLWGVIVIFLALAWLAGRGLLRWMRKYLVGLDATRKVGNFFLRKRIEREAGAKAVQKQPLTDTLPAGLLAAYSEDAMASRPHLLPRDAELAQFQAHWKHFTSGRDGSVAIVGENGMGKSVFVDQVEAHIRKDELPVAVAVMEEKLLTEVELIGFLSGTVGVITDGYTVMSLVRALLAGPRRAVVIDDCHHTFLRGVEGFGALDALLDVVSLTNHHVFWTLAFDELAWTYMNRFRSWGARVKLIKLTGFGDDGVRKMIESRVRAAGFQLSFDNLVVSRGGQDRGYQVVESAAGYFRLLTEFSEGNPRVAVRYWLRSLSVHDDGILHVSLFDTEPVASISELRSDEGFALAAVIQHDTLDASQLSRVLGAEVELCALYLNAWRETGLLKVDPKTGRARVVPDQLRQLRRQLAEIHFLYGA
jgi:hypothetical protein